jgi:hypothetical protein
MKWLVLLGAAGVVAFMTWWLLRGKPGLPARSQTVAGLASTVLSLILIVGAAYTAHRVGIMSLPLVVLAFVPLGIGVRWLLFATRDSRDGRVAREPAENRLWDKLTLPVLTVMVIAIAVLGVVVGTLVGRH